ncbi:uncharacterized protein TRAVEDRAFT_162400 [Trametes versicolor FP-101664 SS1]|uniref:uncharacterized protein n=1 Tax=Trametes versicolor (strain FP-101664) TaxID=717944 RepID=UPI00046226CD|nr:uncharacterized protein TRAVEDRAFT_162400 [Trametes versicolor FP-101664 SS1]EIW61325.1 hypothetical protein TRAVEDRAFT_162400 [Trametes versicolor FP-101664 SS1]
MSSSTSGSSSDSERASSSSPPPPKRARVSDDADSDDSDNEENSDGSGEESDAGETSDTPVLSHAEKRRQKKKDEAKAGGVSAEGSDKKKVKNSADLPPSKVPKRQNSVWIGNLAFKTDAAALRNFFEGVGEITRIHMPMKMVTGGPQDRRPRQENRGFAYVDFATPDAKTVAITMSENNLDGRRLLIKDGDDFKGRPAPVAAAPGADGAEAGAPTVAGISKTGQKILRVQKQPPGPTLFFGNLGFETTDKSIRALLDSHRPKPTVEAAAEGDAADKWIRKIRMGTFEDTGKCKGWAFVDFTTAEHATVALTNPRNHQLDGRKLVVEYASPEAVRRGGAGPRPERKEQYTGKRARAAADAAEGEDTGSPAKRQRFEDAEEGGDRGRRGDGAGRGGRGGRGGKGPRPRTRPGAALALAKREDVAIVPSQGKKTVF